MTIFSFLGEVPKAFEWLGRSAVRGYASFGRFYGGINRGIMKALEYAEIPATMIGGVAGAGAVAVPLAMTKALDWSFQGAQELDDKWNGNGERLNQIEKERKGDSSTSTLPLPYIAPKVIGQGNLQIIGGGKNPYNNNNVVSDAKPKNVISTVVNNSKNYTYM